MFRVEKLRASAVRIPLLLLAIGCTTVWIQQSRTSSCPFQTATGNPIDHQMPNTLESTAFVPNSGQWPCSSHYVARFGMMTVLLETHGWLVSLAPIAHSIAGARALLAPNHDKPMRGATLRMTFDHSGEAVLVGEQRVPGVHNYFLGNDPARWRTDVPRFAAVTYRGLYPGVDLQTYEKDGHFEYDLLLAPGADLSRVTIRVEGADSLHIDPDGALIIETAAGPLRQPRPSTHELVDEHTRREIPCEYYLQEEDCFGFSARTWDEKTCLVIDPGLTYSTLLGGSGNDHPYAACVDNDGVATIVGVTWSANFPVTPGSWDMQANGAVDVFVARLDNRLPAARQLVYSAYLGGRSEDYAYGLSVDGMGVITVVGSTWSTDFPTTQGAWRRNFIGGVHDAFVAQLDPGLPSAQQLVYSTFLGGASNDEARSVSIDTHGVATLTGSTNSRDFPTTTGAWDSTLDGYQDAFVVRLDPTRPSAQQIVYSTFLGGAGGDVITGHLVDAAGVTTITGVTTSSDFPATPGAWDATYNGGTSDVFVSRLDPSLPNSQQLVYSTYLGGTDGEQSAAIATHDGGVTTVFGHTLSSDFPTTSGAWDNSHNGGADAFWARVDPNMPSAQQLVYSTFMGGARDDYAYAGAVDTAGMATLAGQTNSSDFPTTEGAWDRTNGGSSDVFVARFDAAFTGVRQLVYSTLLGDWDSESLYSMSLDSIGAATLGGSARSNFPTTPGAWDTTHNGGWDAFVARLDLLPTGARVYGASSPGCTGQLTIGVSSMPRIGNTSFTLTCSNAPPSANGVLLMAAQALPVPIRLMGIDLWIDPSAAWFMASPARSNSVGGGYFALPLRRDPWLSNQPLHAQFIWLGPTSPFPCPPLGLSASNALEVTIQP